jgi:hypothetical protein
MTRIRRAAVLIGVVPAVMIAAAIPASATFRDSAAVPTTSIGTTTVAAPAAVTVDDWCLTTTTTEKRTTYRDPSTGATTQTGYSWSRSEARNTYNEQSNVTTTAVDPANPNVTTSTTVTKTTDLIVNVWWTASGSRGVSGYAVAAHPYGGAGQVMAQTSATATSTGARVSAYNLDYAATLSVTTLTSYGWTAQSAQTAKLSC